MEEKIKAILEALEGVRYIDWKRIVNAIESQYTGQAHLCLLDQDAADRAIRQAISDITPWK